MNNQYYPNYIGGPATSTVARSAQTAAYADPIPHETFGGLGYPYEAATLQHGNTGYQVQDGLGGPSMIDQPDNVTMGSPYEYFSGSLPDEDFEMPEREKEIQRERRKAQNRTAQKAFRHRKETRIKELEQRLENLEKEYKSLEKAFEDLALQKKQLQAENEQLLVENANLRGGGGPYSVPTTNYDVRRWPSASYGPEGSQHLYGSPGQ